MTAGRVRFATIACYVTFVSLIMSGLLFGLERRGRLARAT